MSNIHWTPGMTMLDVEKQVIKAAINYFKNNKTQTAKSLGMSVRTLDTKLEKMKTDDQDDLKRLEAKHRAREAFLARQRGSQPANQYDTAATPRHVTR